MKKSMFSMLSSITCFVFSFWSCSSSDTYKKDISLSIYYSSPLNYYSSIIPLSEIKKIDTANNIIVFSNRVDSIFDKESLIPSANTYLVFKNGENVIGRIYLLSRFTSLSLDKDSPYVLIPREHPSNPLINDSLKIVTQLETAQGSISFKDSLSMIYSKWVPEFYR